MKLRYRPLVLAVTILSFLPCYAHHLAVVVDKANNTAEITSPNLSKIFKSEIRKWADGKNVVLVMHKDSSVERLTLQRLNRMSAAELKTFIDTHKDSILLADSDAEVLKLVQSNPGAIGLVDVRAVDRSVNVLKVDGKLPLEQGYLPL